jgi:hypothetical protein
LRTGNLVCGNLTPPPSSGVRATAKLPSALRENGLQFNSEDADHLSGEAAEVIGLPSEQ